MKNRVLRVLLEPKKALLYILRNSRIARYLPDELYLKIYYRLKMNSKLNLKHPVTFNEKLQWLKLKDRKPIYTNIVDKYKVRKIVKQTIGENYLIPLIGVYNNFDDIDFAKLPEQFVLKCNHDSGGIVICKDKNDLNIDWAKDKLNSALSENYYLPFREWPYKNVKPKIICEKLMVDESEVELKDYKFFCFEGYPKIIQVDFNRFKNHKRNLYDTNWNLLSLCYEHPSDNKQRIEKPKKLEEMLVLARKLSKDRHFIRIDFYSIYDKVYFGEMTFYPEAGFGKFTPESFNELLGSWINIK